MTMRSRGKLGHMGRWASVGALAIALCAPSAVWAATLKATDLHVQGSNIDVTGLGSVAYRFVQGRGGLLIVDFPGTRVSGFQQYRVLHGGIRRIRLGNVRPDTGRVVVETDPRLVYQVSRIPGGLELEATNARGLTLSSILQSVIISPGHAVVQRADQDPFLPGSAALAEQAPAPTAPVVARAQHAPVHPAPPHQASVPSVVPPRGHVVVHPGPVKKGALAEAPSLPKGMTLHPPVNAKTRVMRAKLALERQELEQAKLQAETQEMMVPMGPIAKLVHMYICHRP